MRSRSLWLVAFLLITIITTAFAEPVFFPRRPGVSPDGSTIVFTFQGDLWSVPSSGGSATRLTVHPAYDMDPVFSPDGDQIAFASDRYGDYDIFVIPANGGAPVRVTYLSTPDIPEDWTPDSESILFSSRRVYEFPMDEKIFTVPASGGTPFEFTDFFASQIVCSPDGDSYVFARGDNRFGRRGYRGSFQSDIWSWTPGSDPVQLTDHLGYDSDPMLSADGQTVYYRSDQGGVFNLWKMNIDGTGKTELTHFPDLGMRNGRISADGSTIAIEAEMELYVFHTATEEYEQVNADVAADLIENPVYQETFTNGADELAVSSDEEEFAMIIEGEIVLVNKDLGGRATIAVPFPSRESYIEFKPGTADTLMFVSDRDGKSSIYLLVSDDEEESLLRKARNHRFIELTPGNEPCSAPQWSPDGDKIAYIRNEGDLHIMDADGDHDRTLFEGWSWPTFSWAPDGNWIAYSREDRNYNADVWIIDVEGDMEPYNVSQHPDDDYGPVWAAEGSMLAWTTRRHSNQYDVYFVYLNREDDERTREEWELWEETRDDVEEEDEAEEDDDDDDDDDDGEEEEEEFAIEIDFDGLYLRARRATSMGGDEQAVAIHPKGDKIYFWANVAGDEDLYYVDRFGEDKTNVTSGGTDPSAISYNDDVSKFYFLKRGAPSWVSADGGSVESTDFRARITIDKIALRRQVLDEGWRGLNEGFYDPDMHGVDWDAVRTQFLGYVDRISHDNDFADLMTMLARTLNASHSGYYPNGRSRWYADEEQLGLQFDPEYRRNEGLRIEFVLPHSPADRVETQLQPGDIILAVNDIPVSRTENFYNAMEQGGGDPVYVSFRRGREEMEYEIQPISWMEVNGLVYDYMTASRREHVEEASDGRIGYLHIEAMGWEQVELFERDLYAAADDKDALIIDVRDNGGGWTTDMLLTILTQPVHSYTIGRNGEIGYPQPRYPLYRWEKPIAVICNEGSYSNAEIFSHAIKTINRGPVVGIQTGGNVISTSGWTLMDGAHIRLPLRGWYVWGDANNPERNNMNQEHHGAIPDYEVPLTPGDQLHDADPQLDRAIELMMEAADEYNAQPQPGPPWR